MGVKAIHLFHHNDLDGRMSAAYFYQFIRKYDRAYTKTIFYEIDYVADIKDKLSKLRKGDMVVFLDYSFSNDNNWNTFTDLWAKMENKIIWIDHHATSTERFYYFRDKALHNIGCVTDHNDNKTFYYTSEMVEVYYTKGYCATYATWCYAYAKLHNLYVGTVDIPRDVPLMIEYVDSYDCWKLHMPNTIEFEYGIYRYTPNPRKILRKLGYPDDLSMFSVDSDSNIELERSIIKKITNEAATIRYYIDNRNEIFKERNAFELDIKINNDSLHCLALNTHGNSTVFGNSIKEYDIVIPFYMTNEGLWKYSLFSDNDFKDRSSCRTIAEALRYTKGAISGGGHDNAAGFVLTKQIFKPDTTIEIKKTLFGKYKYKILIK